MFPRKDVRSPGKFPLQIYVNPILSMSRTIRAATRGRSRAMGHSRPRRSRPSPVRRDGHRDWHCADHRHTVTIQILHQQHIGRMRVEGAEDGGQRHVLAEGSEGIERTAMKSHVKTAPLQMLDLGAHDTARSGDDDCTGLIGIRLSHAVLTRQDGPCVPAAGA
ncbi:hypothetical protein L284_00975 [Novosphingobium lindaniclasticum LE124]|uniref:Uncharacterized protein n=1 Tax=Novosphingobium lindaniclasticum LE124 TaxID=1096930 RepID=T0I2P1_9SPHN|nr:hypothetical protein L284_00975 [Novosphingobium lindaniclasticum LE124]